MNYIAFLTKGLEDISEKELASIDGITIKTKSQKFIRFDFDGNPADLKNLRTVDDVGILLADFATEELVKENFSKIFDMEQIKNTLIPAISEIRNLEETFSVTISLYKSEQIDRDKLKDSTQKFLAKGLGLAYTELDHKNLDFRINIEEDSAFAALKLFPESLYRRDYGHGVAAGTLRSTIAAAMLFELRTKLKIKEDIKLVDNFCGSGTFLCEGHLMNMEVSGGDINLKSINLTRENLQKIEMTTAKLFEQDSENSRWKTGTFDIAASNYPWDKQVRERNLAKLYDDSIKEYARILKEDGVIGLIGIKPELIKEYISKYFPKYQIEEFQIGYLGQSPSIVIAWK